jgi:beta-lactam-binding protein with PASTA domain
VVEVAVTIPDVVGRTEGDARTALERGGFTIGTVLVQASAEPAGTVLSTFPVRGERVALPATVNLVVSSGRSPDGPSPVDSPPPLPRLP